MEIPSNIADKNGSEGVRLFTLGYRSGSADGKKESSDPLVKEIGIVASSIVAKRAKEDYKAPVITDLGQLCKSKFDYGKPEPDRSGVKAIILKAVELLATMEKPVVTPKDKPEPKPEPATK